MRKLAGLLFVVIALTACGKKGPLIYPDMLVPAAPSPVMVQQSGTSMKLTLVLPAKDQAGRAVAGLSGIKVFRRDEPAGQGPGCSDCTTDFLLFRTLNLDLLPAYTQRYGSLLVLQDGDVQPGRTYSYRVSAVTADGQEGAGSATVVASMAAAPLPPVLQAVSQPTEIQLEFAGLPPEEGTVLGYNLYRAPKGKAFAFLPLNREPLTGNRFTDTGLLRRTAYVYGVRMVVQLPSGRMVEGSLSNEAEGTLKDDE